MTARRQGWNKWWAVAAAALIVLGSAVLRIRGLAAGFFLDDYNQRALDRGEVFPAQGPWDLHVYRGGADTLRLIHDGGLPWWTHPDVRFAPLRPLTSILLWSNYRWFDWHAPSFHAVSIAVWVMMAGAAALLYFEVASARVALLALLLFCLARAHSIAVTWISSRGLLLAAGFGFLAVWGYFCWRERASKLGCAAYLIGFTLSLLSGEYGLGIAAYFAAYEVVRSRDPWRKRALALTPAALLALGYLSWHVLGRYGTKQTWWYPNAFVTPGRFLLVFQHAFPSHLTEAFLGLPIDLGQGDFLGWALLATLSIALFFAGAGGRLDSYRWLFAGAIVSAVPGGATWYQPRLLLMTKMGAALVVSAIAWDLWDRRHEREPLKKLRWLVVGALLVLQVPGGAWWSYKEVSERIRQQTAYARAALNAPVATGDHLPEQVFLLNAAVVPLVQTAALTRHYEGERFVPWRILSPAPGAQLIKRTSARIIDLLNTSGGIYANFDARAYRADDRGPRRGEVIKADEFVVQVLATGQNGPVALRFTFRDPLESPRYRFLVSREEGYAPFEMPKIGEERMVLPALPIEW